MSNGLAYYHSRDVGRGSATLHVNAYMAGKHGHGVQFTLGSDYCAMSEGQVRHLIDILEKRLACAPGYSATDSRDEDEVYPDGVKVGTIQPFTTEVESGNVKL